VRFDTALRGYRMDQVDAVLDQLQDRIAELEGRAQGVPEPERTPPAP
jgi:DivIVA domain-containing protein